MTWKLLRFLHFVDDSSRSVFKPGACWPAAGAPGFLQLILCGSSVCVFACVCVSAPEAVNN